MTDRSTSRNTLFDALRGMAAIEVMLFHISNLAGHPLLPGGYLAVDLFFLLSGFVLWNAYGARLANGLSRPAFLRLRLVRLYPLFAVGIALGVVRALGAMHLGDARAPTPSELGVQVVATLFMIPSGFGREGVFPLDNPAWSLSLEMLVNIAFCVWLVRWSPRRLGLTIAVAAVALVAVGRHFGSLDVGWKIGNAVGGPARCVFSFVLGMVMARQRLYVRRSGRSGWPVALGVLAGFTLLLTLDPGAAWRPVYDLGCVFVAFPSIIALGADVRLTGAADRIGATLGDLSYPLYATHYPLILPAMVLYARVHAGGRAVVPIALLCLAVAVALVPIDRAARNALARRRTGRPRRLVTA